MNYSSQASDQQIEQYIFSMPVFQTDGRFDSEKYREILSRNNINADSLAAQIRQDLTRAQLGKTFTGTDSLYHQKLKHMLNYLCKNVKFVLQS